MTEYPAPHQYPVHIPPHQQYIPPSMQPATSEPRTRRRRRAPASATKLNRPLIRFYCNDCKKKFRSRILANRNNNAVQHYCSLYQKIITRKVDSHSNKCRGDHGMGPCVVKRVDEDPDSDGEDETKAAYYADKGKGRRGGQKKKTPSVAANKRKLHDRDNADPSIAYKRQRTNHNDDLLALPPSVEIAPSLQYAQPPTAYAYPPPPVHQPYHGMYHRNGYMTQPPHAGNGFHRRDVPPYLEEELPPPPLSTHVHDEEHDAMPPPPVMDAHSEHQQSVSPGIPMPIAVDEDCAPRTEDGIIPIPLNEDIDLEDAPPPPPPLEDFDPDKKPKSNGNCANAANGAVIVEAVVDKTTDCSLSVNPPHCTENTTEKNGNSKHDDAKDEEEEVITQNGHKRNAEEDRDCINVSGDEEEDDDLKLKIAGSSPSPSAKQKKANGAEARMENENDNENEDEDLTLTPQ